MLPVKTKVIKSIQELWKVGLVMRGKLKTIVCSLMGAVLMMGSASAITVDGSFCGINDYLKEPDRAGATYVTKLNTELAVAFGSSYNYSGTLLKDSQVTASALKSRLNASPKTILHFPDTVTWTVRCRMTAQLFRKRLSEHNTDMW